MKKTELKPCPFCSEIPKFKEYYETCDGRGDENAKVICKCGAEMSLTFAEFCKATDDFGYTGGYYSQNKKFWNGMHQRLKKKWNTRKGGVT